MATVVHRYVKLNVKNALLRHENFKKDVVSSPGHAHDCKSVRNERLLVGGKKNKDCSKKCLKEWHSWRST